MEHTKDGLNEELAVWLADFEKIKGRKLKVLHVGNIAANGFLNAKFMRRVGIEADVLCYDYYHIMAYPEWEELAIHDDYKQDILPQFSEQDRAGYARPKWFAQGPFTMSSAYLQAKNAGNQTLADKHWNELDAFLFAQETIEQARIGSFVRFFSIKRNSIPFLKLLGILWRGFGRARLVIRRFFYSFPRAIFYFLLKYINIYGQKSKALKTDYKTLFPERTYQLKGNDMVRFFLYKSKWKKLFEAYDIVQCYSTDPIYGLLFSEKPYVAFEHGTLRTFTSDDSALNCLTALAYRRAKHAFITNGDCLPYAQNLGMDNFSPMIHPIDIEQHRKRDKEKTEAIRVKYGADVLLFCPLRHDWEIKGTDKHIRALPEINRLVSGKVVLLMTSWGADLDASRALAKSLDVNEQIIWISPLSRLNMIEMLQACDVVLDQTILPCFGSTAPQALACGTPTIMSYKPETTAWIIKEPAPLLQAMEPPGIAACVKQALDPDWLNAFKQEAAIWIDTYHSVPVALHQQLGVYKQILEEVV
jgi:glycosyltransferase involved in cell wall biosynthesis|tara:strand:+ start:73220 stop:74809 length:1590 start_codon:yes stop_codon:yes gene_type:complete